MQLPIGRLLVGDFDMTKDVAEAATQNAAYRPDRQKYIVMMVLLNRRSRTGVLMPRQTLVKLRNCKHIASDTPSSMVTVLVAQAGY